MFGYFEPMKTTQDRSDVTGSRSFNSSGKRVLNLLGGG